MTTQIKLITFLLLISWTISAQVPQGFQYQAVARLADNQPLLGTPAKLQFEIIDAVSEELYYKEEHTTISSLQGIIALVIGQGAVIEGAFNTIPWGEAILELQVYIEIENSGEPFAMGKSPLLAVPYALWAKEVENKDDADADPNNEIQQLSFDSLTQVLSLSQGGSLQLPHTTKSSYILDTDGDTEIHTESNHDEDEVRIKINGQEFLKMDGRRLEIHDSESKSTIIGYQAGENDMGKDPFDNPNQNVMIGTASGKDNTQGYQNVFLGNLSGNHNQVGRSNVFVGFSSGAFNLDGFENAFLGHKSGLNNRHGIKNVFLGAKAGRENLDGERNVAIGHSAGTNNTFGHDNTLIGSGAGFRLSQSDANTLLGALAGSNLTQGNHNAMLGNEAFLLAKDAHQNTIVGALAGREADQADQNVIIGYKAGMKCNGDRNIFIGHLAGFGAEGSNKLYIHNNASNTPLIYGEFNNELLRTHGYQEIKSNSTDHKPHLLLYEDEVGNSEGKIGFTNLTFPDKRWILGGKPGNLASQASFKIRYQNEDVMTIRGNGDLNISGNFNQVSDRRLKQDIQPLSYGLSAINALHPVTYRWKEAHKSPTRKIGFLAQEVQRILPELVVTTEDDLLAVDYVAMIPVLVSSIQELKAELELLRAQVRE